MLLYNSYRSFSWIRLFNTKLKFIWEKLRSVQSCKLAKTKKPAFLKRASYTLLHVTVCWLTNTPLFIEDLQQQQLWLLKMPACLPAYQEFIRQLEKRIAELDSEFFAANTL